MTQRDEFFFVERENMPCIYELSFNALVPAIAVRVHKESMARWPSLNGTPIVSHFLKSFGFSRFEDGSNGSDFGFEGVFKRIADEKEFVAFEVAVPAVKKRVKLVCSLCSGDGKSLFGKCLKCKGQGQADKMCPECGGSGKDDIAGVCLFCDGKGKEEHIDYQLAYAISASFTLFFELTALQMRKDEATSCSFSQLVLVDTITERKQHGGSLGGTYSVPLSRWLSLFEPDTEIAEMTQAMVYVWEKMFGRVDKYEGYKFYSKIACKNGWLNVSCPGDACGLHPADHWGPDKEMGYKFACHNVDTPAQQIALLAGLAALCDRARKEIKAC